MLRPVLLSPMLAAATALTPSLAPVHAPRAYVRVVPRASEPAPSRRAALGVVAGAVAASLAGPGSVSAEMVENPYARGYVEPTEEKKVRDEGEVRSLAQ